MPSSGATAAALPTPIRTVVVLVLENRSFDHILGWMKSLNPEIDGVDGNESNPVSTADPASTRVYFGDRSEYVDPDPGHSFQAIYEQVYGVPFSAGKPATLDTPPTMDGFVQQAKSEGEGMTDVVMNGFRPEAVPVYAELVREFAVCDRWFASLPTSTQANRLYLHSATSHGATSNDTKRLVEGFPQRTIFESLHEAGFSFGIYFQSTPTTLFYRNLRKLKYVGKFHQFDLEFKRHCREGKLPNYVVIEPRYFDQKLLPANDDHPKHDVAEGQKLVKEVYEALRGSPQWEQTLLLVTYDEHGGFFDHVPTPVGVPSPDDIVGPEPFFFKFDRLGVRVPAILVSPWIDPGTVIHEPSGPYPNSQYEHSSIPATVKKLFNLKEFLNKRDAWAGTFDAVLNRTTTRTDCPVTLPEPKKLRKTEAKEEASLSEFQGELAQLGAALKGDHTRGVDLDTLPEKLTVAAAAQHVRDALEAFHGACRRRLKSGADESEVVVPGAAADDDKEEPAAKKTFANKMLSCLACNRS
ncbi:hypothetical protein Taro_024248 [Colocasia esculenta]|uniref:Uncharacterized protein n=1 Tax=Colocasia esculenta TaxID=4460 RepID=A0A843VD41_COLES|nr:hypothetical protein [Colocasia esculenta]